MATVVQKYAAATAVRSTYNSVYNTSAKGTPAPVASGQAVTYNRPQATQTATYNSRGATVPPVSTASAGSQAGTVVVKVSGTTTSRCTTPAVVATSTRVTTTGTTGNTNRVGTPAVVATNSVKTTTANTTATRITTPAVTVSSTRVTTIGTTGNTNRVGTPAVVATGSFQMIDFGNPSLHIMTSAVLAGIPNSGNSGYKVNVPLLTMYWDGRQVDFSKINSMLTPFPTAPTTVETVQVQEEKKNEQLHKWLDGAGLIPYIGDWVDLVNGGIYAFEGDWLNALISASAIFLDGATAGRLATDVTQEMVERGVREGAEEVAERAGRETAEDITEAAIKGGTSSWVRNLDNTSDLNVDDFLSLKDNGVVKVNTSGSDRPLTGAPNSYYKTGNGEHIFVYDGDGKLIYDINSSRVKGFKINVDPNGIEHYQAYKLEGAVPDAIKKLFGW